MIELYVSMKMITKIVFNNFLEETMHVDAEENGHIFI